ncbi:pyruvate carboxylase [Corynebacterium pelargi]|uniref:Methylmalonyl-CoA carboxyltransferase 5S subunit n=1 Tax=Corynebacterium pelargi TaxID=1471400 RepID=A0A410W7N4_9CORY|nr:pyruvate carboxylase [Corynebacterium pelargi]QAU51962.1 Methylmalonyl-CoA carboxyltransferase 5S subunit [Corynebacterium pelargi]GGG71140.1 carboxylase [Corynebacterium pelargi]
MAGLSPEELSTETIAEIFAAGGRPADSMGEIKIVDTTLRDAHQSIWATRMTTDHMMSIIDDLSHAGFEHVDLVAPIQFDVPVRYLKEDPWERVRKIHQAAPHMKFRAMIRSKNLASFDFLPDDVIINWIDRLYANGFRVIGSFDGLNDMDNIVPGLVHAKELGAETYGCLAYCLSPVHTDELYIEKAKELVERADVDRIMLKDAGGLLTPDRIRTIIPAIREAIGPDRTLELHTHSLTGVSPLVYIFAAELGVNAIHCSTEPLANGPGQPGTLRMARDLRALGYTVNIDDERLERVSDRIREIADLEGKPLGQPRAYDGLHYMHQLPGGMLTNFESQLATAGLEDRFEELLYETARVRKELAYPIMITPFAQFVGTQAVMNVISGERYSSVPNEIKKYVLGYYGEPLAPIEPEALEKILANGSAQIPEERPTLEPMMPGLKERYPDEDIDTLLLRAMFAGSQVDAMKEAVANGTSGDEAPGGHLAALVQEMYNVAEKGQFSIKANDLEINLTKGEK